MTENTNRCGSCGHANRAERRFCAECGAPLAMVCPSCGASNQPGEKFCGACGAALGEVAKAMKRDAGKPLSLAAQTQPENIPEGERKTVTALFADIKGSMELMEDLDPEEARAIVDPALKLMMDAVHHYGGYIVQSTGDGIFALFGAPVAHEDHPQRALYAAFRMQEELKRYSDRIRSEGRLPIQVRVGVNTGEVVMRSIKTDDAHAEYTPIGHSISLAARMQALAPIGSIASTEQVRKLCEGYFIFKSLGPTKVKGVSESVEVFEVTGRGPLRTRLQRSAGRGYTKFVGRQREMDAMKHAAEMAKAGHGQIVAAMAEAGVGKSRLFFEFKAISQSGWMVLETFSVSHGKASAYLPVIDLLHGYFKITGGDDQRARRAKVTGNVLTLDRSLEDTLPFLFALLGIVEGDAPLAQVDVQIRKRRTLDAIKRLLLRESLNQPLIVIFEDLHWIDDETQALLTLLADSIGTAKILLLVNYRPEYSHGWGSKTYYTQLRLDPLGKDSAEEMLEALVGNAVELGPLKRLIIRRTEGNPFFMEEMVQALFEERALARNGTVKLAKSLGEVKVPATVQAILAARIDRLPPDEKELLQILAVIGKEFPLSLVREVVGPGELERRLEHLQLAEFIYEQPAVGDVEYTFKHALTQEVAYNSVLGDRRRMLHEHVGQAIEKLFAGRLDEHFVEVAHHFGRSDNVRKAARYMRLSGQRSYFRSELEDAARYLTAGLELLGRLPEGPERDHEEIRAQLVLGTCSLYLEGGGDNSERAYQRALELAERVGDSASVFRALIGLQATETFAGQPEKAFERSKRLLELAERLNDPVMLTEACYWRAVATYATGDLDGARRLVERAITIRERLPARSRFYYTDPLAYCQTFLGQMLCLLGFPDQALRLCERALSTPGSSPGVSDWQVLLAMVYMLIRDWRQVLELSGKIIQSASRLGQPLTLVQARMLRGWALTVEGHMREGLSELNSGLSWGRVTGAIPGFVPFSLINLAQAQGQMGKPDEGLSIVAHLLGDRSASWLLGRVLRVQGELILAKDPAATEQAEDCCRRAIAHARQCGAKWFELEGAISLARLLKEQGRRDEARAMLAEIYGWFTEGFDTADLKEAKALLEELSS